MQRGPTFIITDIYISSIFYQKLHHFQVIIYTRLKKRRKEKWQFGGKQKQSQELQWKSNWDECITITEYSHFSYKIAYPWMMTDGKQCGVLKGCNKFSPLLIFCSQSLYVALAALCTFPLRLYSSSPVCLRSTYLSLSCSYPLFECFRSATKVFFGTHEQSISRVFLLWLYTTFDSLNNFWQEGNCCVISPLKCEALWENCRCPQT